MSLHPGNAVQFSLVNTLCKFNNSYKEFIKHTSNSRQSSHAPGSAGLLTSFWHPHEAVDMLLCILQREIKRKLGYNIQAMHLWYSYMPAE